MPAFFGNLVTGMHYAVQCQEEVPFESIYQAWNRYQDVGLTALRPGFESIANYFAICKTIQAGKPTSIENKKVKSLIPTLVLSGHYDTQTPTRWARNTARKLKNSQFVFLPMSGHITLKFSECARDLAKSFLMEPELELNVDCVQGLKPNFRLPNDNPESE